METSKSLVNIFEEKGEDAEVVVNCEYSEKFNKWVTKKITNKDIGNVGKIVKNI